MQLQKPCVLALFGDLGAGKTTFMKGIAQGLEVENPLSVSSPTFTYLHIYEGRLPLYHFDLYRLTSYEQFRALGFEEYLRSDGVCCIEWADHALPLLPFGTITATLTHAGSDLREITISTLETAAR